MLLPQRQKFVGSNGGLLYVKKKKGTGLRKGRSRDGGIVFTAGRFFSDRAAHTD